MSDCPCHHCDEHSPYCHSDCDRYIRWAEHNEARRKAEFMKSYYGNRKFASKEQCYESMKYIGGEQ